MCPDQTVNDLSGPDLAGKGYLHHLVFWPFCQLLGVEHQFYKLRCGTERMPRFLHLATLEIPRSPVWAVE
jgi:hypothetical protein